MRNTTLHHSSVRFSVRIYKVLLSAYPAEFQKQYGSDMLQVFQDHCLHSFRANGTDGMISLWGVTLIDFIQSLVTEHIQKEIYMTKSKWIRLSGWLLVAGAIGFLFWLFPVAFHTTTFSFYISDFLLRHPSLDMVFIFGNHVAPILIGLGLLGLYVQYGELTGANKYILLFGALAGISTFLATGLIQILTLGFSTMRIAHLYTSLGGVFFMFLCLAIFGIQMLIKRPRPKWNGLELIAGCTWIAVSPILIWILSLHFYTQNWLPSFVLVAGYFVSTTALVMLGIDLQANPNQEIVTA